ncbi:hypothetical protein GMRT_14938 [Giardia muris]|uniref:Uncharacterized protein n=1 Tax=Giardia muris TaxID=5742 RepID=A0A4Z1SPY0_GIAMU|nr:hypothetical protein GMRT_14938 [Giardia muris]|eukprot:TNJ27720.1 hypothetical protein GMRT_14938 [Giardia muris]
MQMSSGKMALAVPDIQYPAELIDQGLLADLQRTVHPEGEPKKTRGRYLDLSMFATKKVTTPTPTKQKDRPFDPFLRETATADLAVPLERHRVCSVSETSRFLETLEAPDGKAHATLDDFYRRVAHRPYPRDVHTRPHKALQACLLENGVDPQTAAQVRRVFYGFFETPENLRHMAAYRKPGTDGITTKTGAMVISGDAHLESYYEERRRHVDRTINALLKRCGNARPNEDAGFSGGVSSVFMPTRVFFGQHQLQTLFRELGPTNPFAIEDDIDYDCLTCGFDQSEEEESSTTGSESGPDPLLEKGDSELQLQAAADDLESTSDEDFKTEAIHLRVDKFAGALQYADRFTWPVPSLVPENIAGARARYLISSSLFTDHSECLERVQREETEITTPVTVETCHELAPVFLRGPIDGTAMWVGVQRELNMTDIDGNEQSLLNSP